MNLPSRLQFPLNGLMDDYYSNIHDKEIIATPVNVCGMFHDILPVTCWADWGGRLACILWVMPG